MLNISKPPLQTVQRISQIEIRGLNQETGLPFPSPLNVISEEGEGGGKKHESEEEKKTKQAVFVYSYSRKIICIRLPFHDIFFLGSWLEEAFLSSTVMASTTQTLTKQKSS